MTIGTNSYVTSNTEGSGNAGSVSVSVGAGTLMIDGSQSAPFAGIQAFAEGSTGDVGMITVTAGNLSMIGNAAISTVTLAPVAARREMAFCNSPRACYPPD
jgi:hypothetical protein